MATNVPVTLDTPITIKVQIQGATRKFKLPLRDLTIHVLPDKLRFLLGILPDQDVVFERFSDSAGAFVTLDPKSPQVYKTLFRAAKAKLKLRMRANIVSENTELPGNAAPAAPSPLAATVEQEAPSLIQPVIGPLRISTHGPPREFIPRPGSSARRMHEALMAQRVPVIKHAHDDKTPSPSQPAPPVEKSDLIYSPQQLLAFRAKTTSVTLPSCSWSVYCNACDKPMADEHYHCSICDDGDYDLCATCVDAGIHCPGEGHWLIKRFVRNGSVINSTTERIGPKPHKIENEIPGAFTEEEKQTESELEPIAETTEVEPVLLELEQPEVPTRTCNSCVKVFPENDFVTCSSCDDFDLCIPCHIGARHGHHPGHAFAPATTDTKVGPLAEFLCAPGRNVRHAAVCDGCDKFIYGVRHKCLTCPDFDYCSSCVKNSRFIHREHRFVPIYEPLPEPRHSSVRHYGIYCDGPLCKTTENRSYVEGVRYKCAVCHDTDFCARCEALPQNMHNRTHPLIMFKSPVRNVNVTTIGEDKHGAAMPPMGDRLTRKTAAEARSVTTCANAATQVQTIVDVKPSEEAASPRQLKEKIEIKDLLTTPVPEKIKVEDLLSSPLTEAPKAEANQGTQTQSFAPTDFNAHFVRDVVPDGSKLPTGMVFSQAWTLKNPGPHDWPSGCSVRYVGGDNMLNVDDNHPSSADDIAGATESNTTLGPVKVGQEVDFVVRMKAPKREGTAISYWRLKTADGTPFGHRLWCHINVASEFVDPADVPECVRGELIEWRTQLKAQEDKRRLEEYNEHLKRLIPEQRPEVELASKLQRLKLEKDSAEAVKQEEKSDSAQRNTMIFPQLEKESPVASTHDVAQTSSSTTNAEPTTAKNDDLDSFDDEDEMVEISSTDDGFLTDEEYDILDASDEERA